MYVQQQGGGIVHPYPHTFRQDGANSTADMWYVWKAPEKRTQLENGTWLGHFFMLCDARAKLADSCRDLEAAGDVIVAKNTDAAYIRGSFTTPSLNKSDPANLGRRTWTPKECVITRELTRHYSERAWIEPPPRALVDHVLENEFSCMEAVELSRTSNLLMLGACPGAGKTSLVLNVVGKRRQALEPMLFCSPFNYQCKARLREGVEHVDTIAHLLGQRFEDNGEAVTTGGEYVYRKDQNKPLSYFKSIVIDELMTLDAPTRELLRQWMRVHGGEHRIFATGDVQQLTIERDLNPTVDIDAYLTNWSRELFPHAIMLREPKRVKLAKDRELVLGLMDALKKDRAAVLRQFKHIDLKDAPTNARFITYTNETRGRINNEIYYREHTEAYVVGGTLAYRERSRKQGAHHLYASYWYTITGVTDEIVSLEEEDEPGITFQLKRATVDKWFTRTYASTVHAAQGATYEGVVVIADVTHPRITEKWLNVALTRATKPRANVYILNGRHPAPLDVARIERQIQGHNAADIEAGREVGDDGALNRFKLQRELCTLFEMPQALTVDWVLQRDATQGGVCALCGESYTMPRVGGESNGSSASIDRILSHRGHETSNCWIVCRSCNFAKRDALV